MSETYFIENSFQLFIILAPVLCLMNSIAAFICSFKYKNTEIYKKFSLVWFAFFISTVAHVYLIRESRVENIYKSLMWLFVHLFLIKSVSSILTDFKILDEKNKSDIPVQTHTWLVGFVFLYTLVGLSVLFNPQFVVFGDFIALVSVIAVSAVSLLALSEINSRYNEMQETLKNTSRLAALGTMVAEIAHELKNPLAILEMNTYQLKINFEKGKLDQDYMKSKIEVYDRMTKRLSKIVESLKISYQSGDNSDKEIITVGEIFEEAKVLSDMRASKYKIALTFDKQNESHQLHCRTVQITQVLQNLIHNAIDAVNSGKSSSDKWVKIETKLVDKYHIEISVADSGPGIPENIRERIFDTLFTTKKNGLGTGLGLSISRRFIEEHGGYLELASGLQTKFVIGLPLYQTTENTKVSTQKVS